MSAAVTDLKTLPETLSHLVAEAQSWVDTIKTHHLPPGYISQFFISIKMVKWIEPVEIFYDVTKNGESLCKKYVLDTRAKHICKDVEFPEGSYNYQEEIDEISQFVSEVSLPFCVRYSLEAHIPNRLKEIFTMDIVQLRDKTYGEVTKELSKF